LKKFENQLNQFDICLNEEQKMQFQKYFELLIEWNKVMNLTAITEREEVNEKHFVDSLAIAKDLDMNNVKQVIDIGTGAGFPGIPLKIAFPHLEIALLDSLQKRVKFLNEVIFKLQLKKICVFHGRAEDYARKEEHREKYDLCVSRAVANLASLSEYCIPYVKEGGKFISYKSEKILEEIKDAEYAITVLGGEIEEQVSFCLPDSDVFRNLFVVKKCSNTPGKYPRKAGIVSKKPLVR